MIVEDEFLIRLTLAEALTDDGFDVIEAASGPEALTMLDAAPAVALLLTDLQLPGGLDGVALAQAVRERIPDLPVIFMTGRPDTMPPAMTPRDVTIAKPYQLADICATARRLTDR